MDNHPLTIVIFGASGDLFKKKLAQAFFDLYKDGFLAPGFSLFGVSRRSIADEDFRAQVLSSIETEDKKLAKEFVENLFFRSGDIDDKATYDMLKNEFTMRDDMLGLCTRKLFYLAVIPDLYEKVFRNLSASGLTIPCAPEFGDKTLSWVRVLVEKPFGKDAEHAEMLDELLGKLFEEDQIFRIDHYLGKEILQNILAFRFGNALFEPLWSKRHVSEICVRMHETSEKGSLAERAKLYDALGALRDVGQNHLLQMLAIATMENPLSFSAEDIREARTALLSSIKVKEDIKNFAHAQYDGYQDEPGIEEGSDTETYFRAELEIKNERWKGVPIFIEHGKALKDTLAEISITFKASDESDESMFVPATNKLTFHIQPKEGISIEFYAKKSAFQYELEKKKLSFDYKSSHATPFVYPYVKLLRDAISGDQTLFVSTDEIKEQWRIASDIEKVLEDVPLLVYPKGSDAHEIKED